MKTAFFALLAVAVTMLPPFTDRAAAQCPTKAMYGIETHERLAPGQPLTTSLVNWAGHFSDRTGNTITYRMAGTNPAKSNATTTIPVYIIPIKMVYGKKNGNMAFDPDTQTV